jgi:hypothetical protein
MTKILSCAVVVGLLIGSSSSVFARGGVNNGGANASLVAPGRQTGTPPVPGPGASGWAPGHQISGSSVTPPGNSTNGAAIYAPGFLK